MVCIHLSDEFSAVCVNAECPACCDFCPCVNYPEICKYAESGELTTESRRASGRNKKEQ